MKELTVIIPVYNEAGSIGNVLESWLAVLRGLGVDFSIVALNDGSKDDSLAILRDLAARHREIRVIDKPNSGHGPTILEGYRSAESKWIFQVDSDNEMDSSFFPTLWGKREDYDLLLGKRVDRQSPLVRKLIAAVSRLTVKIFFGFGVSDVNAPYRLYRAEKFRDAFVALPPNTFAPNVILSGYAARSGMRILEMPVPTRPRATGEVSLKKWKLFRAACKSLAQTVAASFRL